MRPPPDDLPPVVVRPSVCGRIRIQKAGSAGCRKRNVCTFDPIGTSAPAAGVSSILPPSLTTIRLIHPYTYRQCSALPGHVPHLVRSTKCCLALRVSPQLKVVGVHSGGAEQDQQHLLVEFQRFAERDTWALRQDVDGHQAAARAAARVAEADDPATDLQRRAHGRNRLPRVYLILRHMMTK